MEQNYHVEPALVTYDRTLTANEERLSDTITNTEDYPLVILGLSGYKLSDYELQLKLPSGRYLSQSRIRDTILVGQGPFPILMPGAIVLPPRGQLGLNIKNLAGANNPVQIVLWCERRVPV